MERKAQKSFTKQDWTKDFSFDDFKERIKKEAETNNKKEGIKELKKILKDGNIDKAGWDVLDDTCDALLNANDSSKKVLDMFDDNPDRLENFAFAKMFTENPALYKVLSKGGREIFEGITIKQLKDVVTECITEERGK